MELKDRLKQTFIDLIKINEIYPHENEVILYTEKRLTKAGVAWKEDAFRNVIATIPGTGDAVMLSTHLDVPEPNPDVRFIDEGDILRSDGTNILGADPKTGLAVLIELATDLAKQDPSSHVPVELVLTRGEESGLNGAQALDYSMVNAKIGLVLDEDGPVTQVVTQAPAFVKIDASCVGKIVHPREPEKGINALQIATEAMQALPWGYMEEGVTWNIGMFEAGTARNSVPGKASFKAELRSYETDKVVAAGERVENQFRETTKKYSGTCEMNRELEFEGYKLERTHSLFARLEKTFTSMNLTPNYFKTFGGTDANIFNREGVTSVPIGSGYYNAHEYTEYADLNDMAQIHSFLLQFIVA
jgi:tripeptide aminopeptidase